MIWRVRSSWRRCSISASPWLYGACKGNVVVLREGRSKEVHVGKDAETVLISGGSGESGQILSGPSRAFLSQPRRSPCVWASRLSFQCLQLAMMRCVPGVPSKASQPSSAVGKSRCYVSSEVSEGADAASSAYVCLNFDTFQYVLNFTDG